MAPQGCDGAEALFLYDELMRRIVVAAKNRGRRDVLRQLGKLLAAQPRLAGRATIDQDPVRVDGGSRVWPVFAGGGRADRGVPIVGGHRSGRPFDLVTWVPASSAGRRRRGYDQGRLLADGVAAGLGIGAKRLLIRRRGQRQAGLGRLARLSGPELWAPVRCPDRVLVVDDVITTGASLSAAAQALRAAGAVTVIGAAVARAEG